MSASPSKTFKYHTNLTELALRLLFEADEASWEGIRPGLMELVKQAYSHLSRSRRKLLRSVNQAMVEQPPRAPPELVTLLRRSLGAAALAAVILEKHPEKYDARDFPDLFRKMFTWLAAQPQDVQDRIVQAAVNVHLGRGAAADQELIQTTLGEALPGTEEKMATLSFDFDLRSLPASFNGPAFQTAVVDELTKNLGVAASDVTAQAAVIGMLLLDEYIDPNAPGFAEHIRDAWMEFLGRLKDFQDNWVYNRAVFTKAGEIILEVRGQGKDATVFYQEFAWVGRYCFERADQVPPDHPNFPTQVRLALDSYVSGKPPIESLELPPLTGADGVEDEIVPDNIRAVSVIYAAYQLEQLRLIPVVDRIVELWLNGLLPITYNNDARALDAYYWAGEDRLNEAARYMQYSRIFGARGGDVSREVKPNSEFDGAWMRFLASLAEYDRQQRIADVITPGRSRSLSTTGENVRNAGRAFAANISLYGYGYTHFAARRLNEHITTAIDILKLPAILKAYGVNSPWQVIERVSVNEFGFSPNIVRFRTMAEAGNKIMDLVAKNARAWSATTGNDLFKDPSDPYATSDISSDDQQKFMRYTQYWLAVNGIKDDQVDEYAQPVETAVAPSLPSMGGFGGGANGNLDQIRQLIAQGQTPSLEQLRSLLPAAGVGV
jgi:hypothetical protein